MFGVFSTRATGEMIWLATLDDEQAARDVADETMLRDEETVMVISLVSFRQQVE